MIRRRKAILLLPVVVGAVAALACSLLQPDRYSASAQILIRQPTEVVQFDPQTGVRRDQSREVQLQADLVTSEEVKARVARRIGATPPVSTTVRPLADVVVVSAEAPTLAEARTVVDTYVEASVELRRVAAAERLLAFLDRTTRQYQNVSDALAARASGGPLDAESRVLLLQQADLRERIDQAQVSVGSRSTDAFTLGPAQGSTAPVAPAPVSSAILAGLAGAFIGVGATIAVEVLDDTIAGRDDIGPIAGRLPVIAEVPVSEAIGRAVMDDPYGPAAEAVRSVRTALPFLLGRGSPDVVLVTSANPAEGKTAIATNLALALAATGRSTCLVSGDLRRPRVEIVLGIEAHEGLSSVLLGTVSLAASLVALPESRGLSVLPAGPVPPNPAELFASVRFSVVLRELRSSFDHVVIDSAPVLPVTDAALLAADVDVVLLVVAAGRTSRASLDRAVEVLDQVVAPIGALVINHPDERGRPGVLARTAR